LAKHTQKGQLEKSSPPEIQNDPFLAEVSKRVAAVVGKQQASQVVAQITALYMEESFSGPIAHPNHLRQYENILPGAADRIIKMAESSMEHSRAIQTTAIAAEIKDTKDGRSYGFWALIALIVAATICGMSGHEIIAGAFLGTGVLGTIGLFVKSWRADGDPKKK
jgi:uncharacterized membrane protein